MKKKKPIELELERLLTIMAELDPESSEYKDVRDNFVKLSAQANVAQKIKKESVGRVLGIVIPGMLGICAVFNDFSAVIRSIGLDIFSKTKSK